MSDVTIHYLRLPDRPTIFQQLLVEHTPECIITLMPRTELPRPVLAGDSVILEPGAPALWFTFPDLWHDIGRFHTVDGTFTGYYANLLTPVRLRGPLEWETTDLFLDVWVGADGTVQVLDEDELADAIAAGHIAASLANTARREAAALAAAAADGAWPPGVVREWTLERALAVTGHLG